MLVGSPSKRLCTFFRGQSWWGNSEKRTRRGCDQRPHIGPQWTDVWTSERRGSDELFLIPPPQTPKDLVDTGDTHSIVNKNWSMEGSTEWRLKLPLVGDRWWVLVGRSLRLGWVGGGEVGKSYVLLDIPFGWIVRMIHRRRRMKCSYWNRFYMWFCLTFLFWASNSVNFICSGSYIILKNITL